MNGITDLVVKWGTMEGKKLQIAHGNHFSVLF